MTEESDEVQAYLDRGGKIEIITNENKPKLTRQEESEREFRLGNGYGKKFFNVHQARRNARNRSQ